MYLIIGLGNPGIQYANSRHNLGFRVLDLLAQKNAFKSKYDAQFLKLSDVILLKPQLFMNLSGKSVAQVLKYYPDAELIVVHDDLDFPLGTIRIQKNVSAAGHNGVQSVIEEIGTQDFIRIRLGVDNPETSAKARLPSPAAQAAGGQVPGEDYVLQKFTLDEETIVKEILVKAVSAIETIQTEGLDIAQSKFNG